MSPRCYLSRRLTPEHPRAETRVPPSPVSVPRSGGSSARLPDHLTSLFSLGLRVFAEGSFLIEPPALKFHLPGSTPPWTPKGPLVADRGHAHGVGGLPSSTPTYSVHEPVTARVLVLVSLKIPGGLSKGLGPTAQNGTGHLEAKCQRCRGKAA